MIYTENSEAAHVGGTGCDWDPASSVTDYPFPAAVYASTSTQIPELGADRRTAYRA